MNNKNIISWLIILGLSLLISGCGWKQYDLSSEEPFNAYLGSNYTLRVSMTLRERQKNQYRFVPHAMMTEKTAESLGKTICMLPEGTKVKVNAVKMIKIDGSCSLYILGNTRIMEENEWIEFEILLGSWTDQIWLMRMPWEDESIPDDRYIPLDESRQRPNVYK